jgi:hypothetical protein
MAAGRAVGQPECADDGLVRRDTNEFSGRIVDTVQTVKFVEHLFFIMGQPLVEPMIFNPGWRRYLHLKSVRPGKVLIQMPVAGAISEINESDLAQQLDASLAAAWTSLIGLVSKRANPGETPLLMAWMSFSANMAP